MYPVLAAAALASCTLEQTANHVYGSSEYHKSTVASIDDCCSACVADSKCNAYTYESSAKTCFLKDNQADGGVRDGATSGRKAPSCTLQPGIEFLGDDVGTPKPTKGEPGCCTSCAADPLCFFFTYEGGTNGLCRHKNTNAPDYSRHNASCTSGYVGTTPPAPPAPRNVSVVLSATTRSNAGPNFVCYNIDASDNRGFFWRNISAEDPKSYGAQLARQASAIGDSQDAGFALLRFGGSGNDYLTYNFGGASCPPTDPHATSQLKTCLNESSWRDLLSFTEKSSAKMIFGLSMNTSEDMNSFPFPWDPLNAKAILEWTIEAGLDHLIYGFELGNEQNGKYSGDQIAQNFGILYQLTIELWPDASKRPVLFGPDPHSLHGPTGSQLAWIGAWLDGCKKRGVPTFGVTHHEYTEVDPTPSGFISAGKLQVNGEIAFAINKTVREHDATVHIFGGEIGPHNGGSPKCDHTSMRWAVWGDSLWYSDALASKAFHGYSGLCRQDYIGADYGMVDCSTGVPLPDFWTAVLWARTMGQGVLTATTTTPGGAAVPAETSSVRVYAHCAAKFDGHPKGSVAILAINLGNTSTTLKLASSAVGGEPIEAYVLGPSDDASKSLTNATGLMGTGVTLNGELLTLGAGGVVPPTFLSAKIVGNSVVIPPTSLAFYVLTGAKHAACM